MQFCPIPTKSWVNNTTLNPMPNRQLLVHVYGSSAQITAT